MVHPTCALARHPDESPGEDKSGKRPTLAAQAVDAINASREAYHAIACVSDLVAAARAAPGDFVATSAELRSLVALVTAEFDRRAQLAKAIIESMPTPERPPDIETRRSKVM
jgi:hypothetical protein